MAKLKLSHLKNDIEKHLLALDTVNNRRLYADGKITNYDKVKNINIRYKFDILYCIPSAIRDKFYRDAYSIGGNDNHITSLLNSIIKDIK